MTRAARLAPRAASLLALLGAVAFSPVFCAAQQTGPSTWVLVYAGGPKRPAYSVGDFVHLIAYVDTADRPAGWLCTGAIFLEIFAPSGHAFATWLGGQPAKGDDWNAYLHVVFDSGGALARLDSAVSSVGKQVGPLPKKYPVMVMIPYPDPHVSRLDSPWGSFSLAENSGRLEAVQSYVNQVVKRFRGSRYTNVELVGFYWLNESISGSDTSLTADVARRIHKLGLRFYWIPYYTAGNVDAWARIGFDRAWLQPNFFFKPAVSPLRLDSAVDRARSLGMGLEIEFDGRLFSDPRYFDRLDPYLNVLSRSPDLRRKDLVIYDGAGALIRLATSKDSLSRGLYSRLVTTLAENKGVH